MHSSGTPEIPSDWAPPRIREKWGERRRNTPLFRFGGVGCFNRKPMCKSDTLLQASSREIVILAHIEFRQNVGRITLLVVMWRRRPRRSAPRRVVERRDPGPSTTWLVPSDGIGVLFFFHGPALRPTPH